MNWSHTKEKKRENKQKKSFASYAECHDHDTGITNDSKRKSCHQQEKFIIDRWPDINAESHRNKENIQHLQFLTETTKTFQSSERIGGRIFYNTPLDAYKLSKVIAEVRNAIAKYGLQYM